MKIEWSSFKVYLYDQEELDKCSYYKVGLDYFNLFFADKEFNLNTALEFKQYIKTFKSPQTNQRLSNYTINNYIKCLKLIGKYLYNRKLAPSYFMDQVKLLKTEPPHTDVLEENEMERFLTVAYNKCYRRSVCIETFLRTGCRPQELFKAKWDQLHGDTIYIINTKTDTPRDVVILADLMEKVEKLQHWPHNYIFGGARGKINRQRFNVFIRECLKEANINKKIRTKEFRHSYATMLAVQGVSHFMIKDAMGHKSINTTQMYIHTTKNTLTTIAKKHPLSHLVYSGEEKLKIIRDLVDDLKRHACEVSLEEQQNYVSIKIPIDKSKEGCNNGIPFYPNHI